MKTAAEWLRSGKVDAIVNINGESAAALKSEGFVIQALPWTMEETAARFPECRFHFSR